jgi:hypothetical protein
VAVAVRSVIFGIVTTGAVTVIETAVEVVSAALSSYAFAVML